MNDLVKQLRSGEDGLEYAAADEIERLNEALGNALDGLEYLSDPARYDQTVTRYAVATIQVSRDALDE